MAITIRQVGPCFAGEVDGIDLAKPLSPEDAAAIHAGMDRYAVLVFHGRPVTLDQQMAFTLALGPIEQAVGTGLRERRIACPPRSRTCRTSTRTTGCSSGTTARGSSRSATGSGTPTARSSRSPRSTPCCTPTASRPGAATPSSRTCARGTTPSTRRRGALCEDLICEHSQIYSRQILGFTDFTDDERERFAPVRQVLVRTHPVTGRKSLYLSSHAGGIIGWPVPEARAFLRDLVEHATQRQFVYSHRWQVGDLVMWDNRQTMHRARPFPEHEPRDVRRTTLAGDRPTVAQLS